MLKVPPAGFVRRLSSFDPSLRVRWSRERRSWIIEAKAKDRRGLPLPIRTERLPDGQLAERVLDDTHDRKIQWKDGYYPVFYTARLTDYVFYRLAAADSTKYKRVGDLWRDIEACEAADEARREAAFRENLAAKSNEVYDYMNNRGSRAFPGGTSL